MKTNEQLRVKWGSNEVLVDVNQPEVPLNSTEMKELGFLVKLAVAKLMRQRERDSWRRPAAEKAAMPPDGGLAPTTQALDLRQKWLFQGQVHAPPMDFAEFVEHSIEILHKWYDRWHGLWRKVNPKNFRSEEEKNHFLRENDLKALGLYHAMRELKVYWREAGVWEGNPYEADNLSESENEVLVPKRSKS